MTSWQLYWLTRLDSFSDIAACLIASGLLGIVLGLLSMQGFPDKVENQPQRIWIVELSGAALILGFLLGTFIPTTKEMAAIIVLPKMVNAVQENEKLKAMPNNLIDLADAWIEKLKREEEENK